MTPDEDVRVRRRSRRRRPWWRRRRTRRWVLLVLGALVVLAALDAIWVGTTAARELRAARDQLSAGADAIDAGHLDDARNSFLLAHASAERVIGATGHPTWALAGMLPAIGDDADAVRALAQASAYVADAGQELVRAADEAGWDGSTIPGLEPGGSLRLDGIRGATPALQSAARLLAKAQAFLGPVRTDGLFGSVRDAVVTARAQLGSKERLVSDATTLSRMLPGFLGADGSRRYLLITSDLSDPRGSGGFPGGYGVLRVNDGRIALERFGATSTLGVVPQVDAPSDVVDRYARFGALTRFYATTYSPDFPTSARLLMEMWEATGRAPVDGVIAVDSVWMSYVLAAIGPVETPAWPEPITAENVSDIVNRQTLLTLSQERSNALQNALADSLFGAVLGRPLPARGFADALARAARERHLQVYSAEPAEEHALDQLGASGRVVLGANPLLVAWDGAVGNRAGYFAEKQIDYRAVVSADGSAKVTETITLTNPAPTSPPSILLGAGLPGDVPVGYYQAFVNAYLPAQATNIEVKGGDLQILEREFGVPVVLGLIGSPAGGSDTLRISYRFSGAVTASGGALEFRLNVLPLPALRPDQVSVELVLPEGAGVIGASRGVVTSRTPVTWTAAPTTPQAVWVRYNLHQ